MKWIARIILLLLTIALAWEIFVFIKDGSNGKHVRLLWGLGERNIPKGYPDTVYVCDPALDSKPNRPPINQTSQSGDNEVNSVGGDNRGIVGGKNNTINLGLKQRTLSNAKLKAILKQLPDTATTITLVTLQNDAESDKYSTAIMNTLKEKGYVKIHIQYNPSMSNKYDSISVIVPDDKKYKPFWSIP